MSPTFDQELEARRQAERAMRLLARPGAVVEAQAGGYGVRLGASRRRRVMLTLDEAGFQALAREATLKVRPLGGWTMTARPESPPPPAPGRPGVIEEEVILPDAPKPVRRNLGESPIAWLARRRDRNGQPRLTPNEAAAGERTALADANRGGRRRTPPRGVRAPGNARAADHALGRRAGRRRAARTNVRRTKPRRSPADRVGLGGGGAGSA
jgi:hypothetical protein